MQTDQYLKPHDAAIYLGGNVNVKKLANWRSRRKGPRYTRIGRSVRYDPAILDLFMRNHHAAMMEDGQ